MAPGADDLRIELVVRRLDGSLTGTARDGSGGFRQFTGWLGLLGVLEAILADPESVTTEES